MNSWKQYYKPETIGQALSLLGENGPSSRIVAGGTDLILDLEFGRTPALESLVDVSTIDEMLRVTRSGGWIEIGAAVTHAQIATHPLVLFHGAALSEGSAVVGGPQVRNLATIGGNIAHALPAADGTTALMALGAQAQVFSLMGNTVVDEWRPLESIFSAAGKNSLSPNQLLGAVRFPERQPAQASAFSRIMRPQGIALPMLGMAIWINLDVNRNLISEARISVGPTGPLPARFQKAESILSDGALDPGRIEKVIEAIREQASLRTSQHRATREYRNEMIDVLFRRVFETALERARSEKNEGSIHV